MRSFYARPATWRSSNTKIDSMDSLRRPKGIRGGLRASHLSCAAIVLQALFGKDGAMKIISGGQTGVDRAGPGNLNKTIGGISA